MDMWSTRDSAWQISQCLFTLSIFSVLGNNANSVNPHISIFMEK